MIHVKDVSFSYGKRTIVDGLNFEAAGGECIVFAGPNGSGKSTMLSLIAGILHPSTGEVDVRGKIGYVPQGTALLEDATVEENLRFFADLAHAPVPKLLPFALENFKNKKISSLSGGMRKQVSIACAMPGEPDVILLDEPCAALDIGFSSELVDMVLSWKRNGRAVLYVGHDPSEFYPFFDKLIFFGKKPTVYSREELSCENELSFSEKFKSLFKF